MTLDSSEDEIPEITAYLIDKIFRSVGPHDSFDFKKKISEIVSNFNQPNSLYTPVEKKIIAQNDAGFDQLYERVINVLINYGYISKVETGYAFTKEGIIAKNLGGHFLYLEWKRKKKWKSKTEWGISYILIPVVTIITLFFTILAVCNTPNAEKNDHPTPNAITNGAKDNHP